jgi:UDP-N-acetylmuramyl pentapeptide phosphotransferase/UDP-N-acetylglucosamine-1-phosphate transferase
VNLILTIVTYFLIIFILNIFFLKKNFLVDKKKLVHKSFASKDLVPISGGFLIVAYLLFFNSNHFANIFFLSIFLLGIFSDLLIIENSLKKFFVQFFIVLTFLFFMKISILSTKIFFIDYFIENKLFALLFTVFCLLILINGSNFLDGINTIVCGYYMLIILVILYIGHYNKINYNFLNFYYLLIPLLIIFIFNFFSKTYLGDSGTFLLSFLVGYELINLSNINLSLDKYISPLFIVLLLWYPAFENLFSIIRKTLSKKKPSEPDNLHLHHLLFSYLKKKIRNVKVANSFTGVVINLYNFIIFLISVNFYNKTNFLIIFIVLNIYIYIVSYFFLLKKITKSKKIFFI